MTGLDVDRSLRRELLLERGGAEWSPERRALWCDWFRRHGVDPNEVPEDAWVERHPDRYRVAFLGVVLTDPDAGRYMPGFVQLEGPPLPFPEP